MKTIKLTIELTYNNKIMHGNDKESIEWFYNYILKSRRKNDLILHSNEIGDEIGTVKVIDLISSHKGEQGK
jgi:hypothetical protein